MFDKQAFIDWFKAQLNKLKTSTSEEEFQDYFTDLSDAALEKIRKIEDDSEW